MSKIILKQFDKGESARLISDDGSYSTYCYWCKGVFWEKGVAEDAINYMIESGNPTAFHKLPKELKPITMGRLNRWNRVIKKVRK